MANLTQIAFYRYRYIIVLQLRAVYVKHLRKLTSSPSQSAMMRQFGNRPFKHNNTWANGLVVWFSLSIFPSQKYLRRTRLGEVRGSIPRLSKFLPIPTFGLWNFVFEACFYLCLELEGLIRPMIFAVWTLRRLTESIRHWIWDSWLAVHPCTTHRKPR